VGSEVDKFLDHVDQVLKDQMNSSNLTMLLPATAHKLLEIARHAPELAKQLDGCVDSIDSEWTTANHPDPTKGERAALKAYQETVDEIVGKK